MRALRAALLGLTVAALVVATSPPLIAEETEVALVAHGADTSEYPTIAVTVTLPVAMLAEGDGKTEFSVRENGEPREVVGAEPLAAVRAPVDIVLLMDTSGSMLGDPMTDARAAASAFIAAMAPEDEFALVSFASDVTVLSGFTRDRGALDAAIAGLESAGNTALYDGVVESVHLLSPREGRERVVVMLTDGGDTASMSTLDEAVGLLRSSGAPMYAIGLETSETDMEVLATLASQSQGKLVGVADSADLERLYEDIAKELTTQYRLTFESGQPATKDIDLEIVASVDGRRSSTSFAIPNPNFSAVENDATGAGIESTSPAASNALAFLIVGLAFGSATLATGAMTSMWKRDSKRLDDLHFYDQLHGLEDTTSAQATGVTSVIRAAVAAVAGQRGFTQLVHGKLDRAGLPVRPVEYIYMHLVGVVTTGIVAYLLARNVILALLATFIAVLLPILLLENAISRRTRSFEEQLPEILSMIASSLRAGWGVQQSIDLVVQEMSDPAAAEFRRVQAQSRLGLSVEEALEKMAERLDSDDFRWTVTAIAIQREVGGNLAEVLDVVATTMRDRAELRRHIRALTSEGRLSAVVLFVLPFVMLLVLAVVSPTYLAPMLSSGFGLVLLMGGALLLIVGGFWLRRASEVEV